VQSNRARIRLNGGLAPGVGIARDPMSPPFHVNLCYGLRFVQVSLLVSSTQAPGAARALPVRFDFAPPAVKPKKNAAPEMHEAYKKEKKLRALPLAGLAAITSVRQSLDARIETAQRQLICSGDGSYTNKRVLRDLPPRTTFIGRIRKDAKLHLPLPQPEGAIVGRPRLYGPQAPTPEQILQDDSIPVQKITCFAAGQFREIPVKVYGPVFWRKAGVDVPLLLVVIKPLGYRLRNGSKLLYRQPAFLVCNPSQSRLTAISSVLHLPLGNRVQPPRRKVTAGCGAGTGAKSPGRQSLAAASSGRL
jgi:hypothetical protein